MLLAIKCLLPIKRWWDLPSGTSSDKSTYFHIEMKAKQRTCKSKYMNKNIMNELCEQLTNSFRLTPSQLDKTPQAPSSEIATPQHTTSDGLTH